ncbi:MAG: GNAT family N-acetyltransferase [Propionibacteriaceae bacterium]|nr:GNAT family N-acetyltransferase [Propionibacteriaceae bacterium]
MTTVQVARPSQLGDVYDTILVRSFQPDELVDKAAFMHQTTWGEVLVTQDDEGTATGVAVADHHPDTGVSVLEYLAVAPGQRGGGAGSALLEAAVSRWTELVGPGALLAEIERPDSHPSTEEFGDPNRRLAFYERHGFQALALPYYQPALSGDQQPVPDLILGILILEPTWANVDASRFVEAPRLEQTLVERNPGSDEQRRAWEALMAATRDPQGIELVPLSEYARIPRSGPIG